MRKNVLIVGAGINQLPLIKLAKRKGLYFAVADLNPDAIGAKYADRFYNISTSDIQGMVQLAKKLDEEIGLDGVTSMAAEVSKTISEVAEELGLPAISNETAEVTTNKLKRYERLRKCGISIPRFYPVKNRKEIMSAIKDLGLPVVIKPVDSAGARGVQKIFDVAMIDVALREIKKYSKADVFIIEEFLQGTEHSSESIVIDNEIYTTGFSDRNYDKKEINPPYFLEDGDSLPTALPDNVYEDTLQLVKEAIKALGINFGPAKGDIFIDKKGPKVLEMASRLSGDYFCWETVPLHNGTDILNVLLDIAVSNKPDVSLLSPKFNRGVALRYFFPKKSGRIKSIKGVDEVKHMEGVYFFKWEPAYENIDVGKEIRIPTCHAERVGCVMTHADTREKAVRIAEKAVSAITIEVE